MAVELHTGLPGNYKTLTVVGLLVSNASERPVFTNIPLSEEGKALLKNVQVVDDLDLANWMDFPDGSLVVIDEVQRLWPARSAAKAVPTGVEELATHRHRGFDIWVITQSPKLIDSWVRQFIQRHYHYDRPFGSPFAFQYVYEGFLEDPAEKTKQKSFIGEVNKLRPNKKHYKLYKSATIHTVKFHLPFKAKLALVFIVCAVFLIFYGSNNFYHNFVARDRHGQAAGVSKVSPDQPVSADSVNAHVIDSNYFRNSTKVSKECVLAGTYTKGAVVHIIISCQDGGFYAVEDLSLDGGYQYEASRKRLLLRGGLVVASVLPQVHPEKDDKK